MTDAPLPLVRRDDLVRAQLPHLARAAGAAPVRVGITGSGPDLLVLTWSAADLARERAAGARLLTRLGVRPGVPVANALPGALATPGSLLLGDVVEEIGALDVPLGPAGDAAAAAALLAAAPPAERPWWRGIVWLRTATSVPPRVRPPAGFGGWQRVWLAVPEATSFVAHTCARGTFHLDEEVRAEVVGAGCVRTLVLTALGFESRLLRYVTGLDARLLDGPCACGAAGAALLLG